MFWILLTSSILSWILYLVVLQIRPLRLPAGPRGWPLVGNLLELGSKPHETMCQLGKKYGRIFTLNFGSIPVVILNHPETIRKVLSMDGLEGRPSDLLPMMKHFDKGVGFSNGDLWRDQRRFVVRKLRDFGYGKTAMEGAIVEDVQTFVEYLKSLNGASIDPMGLMKTTAINSLWAIVAGKKYPLNDPQVLEMQHCANQAFVTTAIASISYFMPWLVDHFPKLTGFQRSAKYAKKLNDLMWDLGVQNAETFDPDAERHFLDSYWKKMLETTKFQSSASKQNAETVFKHTFSALFIGGNDTISLTMSWAVLALGLHPEKCERLYREIAKVVGETGIPTKDHQSRMPYTQATMHEINRLGSVASTAVLRSTTKHVDFEGFSLPKGTIVLPNLYSAHYDQQVWGDPENFRPERFLDEDGNFVKSAAVMAFSVGKRACLAESIVNSCTKLCKRLLKTSDRV